MGEFKTGRNKYREAKIKRGENDPVFSSFNQMASLVLLYLFILYTSLYHSMTAAPGKYHEERKIYEIHETYVKLSHHAPEFILNITHSIRNTWLMYV